MTDVPDSLDGLFIDSEDPRLTSEYVRYRPYTDDLGYVLVVGVVHDHPASVFRVRRILEVLRPDIVALELPQLAIPLFESFTREQPDARPLGGEMTVAIEQADEAKAVGIDAPSWLYTKRLAAHLLAGDLSGRLLWQVGKDLAIAYVQAVSTLLAALVASVTGVRLRAHTPIDHDVSRYDSPTEQAAAEAEHVAQRRAFLQAIEVPTATQLIDTVREQVMAERIRRLRREGDVFAVVGIEHLEPISDRLDER